MPSIEQQIANMHPSEALRRKARHAMTVLEDSDLHDRLMAEADALEAQAGDQSGQSHEEWRQAKAAGKVSPCGWSLAETEQRRATWNATVTGLPRHLTTAQRLAQAEQKTGLKAAEVKASVEFFKDLAVLR